MEHESEAGEDQMRSAFPPVLRRLLPGETDHGLGPPPRPDQAREGTIEIIARIADAGVCVVGLEPIAEVLGLNHHFDVPGPTFVPSLVQPP